MNEKQLRYKSAVQKYLNLYFSNLNSMQKQAVFQTFGPVLILAGAGSGKTTVLVNRVKYMLKFGNAYHRDYESALISDEDLSLLEKAAEGLLSGEELERAESVMAYNPIRPYNILAITFTNKAAGELKERISSVFEGAENLQASTFHSACVRILRRKIDLLGNTSDFAIYDTDDSLKVIKDSLEALNLDSKFYVPKSMLNEISGIKEKMLSPEEFLNDAKGNFHSEMLYKIYSEYQRRLRSANALDFDDIIFLTVKLFKQNPDVLDYYRNIFKFIMVDEYQDTNVAQYQLISLLSSEHKNLCVVGDDDQSIYGFRGATIENILNFESEFEDSVVIKLEQNYRSTSNILNAANGVIANNKGRKGKNLWTEVQGGEKITQIKFPDDRDEIFYIASEIKKSVLMGGKYSDNAILYRMNAQSAGFERVFIENGIPYKIFGGLKFFGRKEIKDLTSYLNLINNPSDLVRFSRVVNTPKRGIGAKALEVITALTTETGLPVMEICKNAAMYSHLHSKARVLEEFYKVISDLAEMKEDDLGVLFDVLIEATGYEEYLKEEGQAAYETRMENILELKSMMAAFSKENPEMGLQEFLENIALYTDLDEFSEEDDCVILMTIHSAKGLEFERVFIPALEEGVFPSRQAMFSQSDIEEERRLAYVALTRAKKKLYLTHSARRMLFGNTMSNPVSRFLEEIPEELLEKEDKTRRFESSFSVQKPITPKSVNTEKYVSEITRKPNVTQAEINYTVGDMVSHRAFGNGIVISMEPMSNDTLVEVAFDKVGTKKIMANFAKLQKI